MTRGKQKFSPKNGASYLANAQTRWAGAPPEWVVVLARQADRDASQAITATRCGFNSASVVSAVINNRYPGKLDPLEARVRGALMKETVQCPVLGLLGRNDCASSQTLRFSAASPQRARLAHTCPTCPNAIRGAKHAQ